VQVEEALSRLATLTDETRLADMAHQKALEWCSREEEYVKRAGYVLIACLAVHDRDASDQKLAAYFDIIAEGASDARNFVKKAVNWSLRQIGKRNASLSELAIEAAARIGESEHRSARWIASDALRELRSQKIQARLARPRVAKARKR